MYIRWLGEYGSFEGMKSFDFEFHRTTESCAEYVNEKYKCTYAKLGYADRFCIRFGLLCDPKKVVRTFKTDAWSQLDNSGRLVRGKTGIKHNGYFDTPKMMYHEAWVAPNAFIGIVIRIHWSGYYPTNLEQGFNNLPGGIQKMIKAAAKRHNVPVYMLREYENKLREVDIM